jgi:hypothetical protein
VLLKVKIKHIGPVDKVSSFANSNVPGFDSFRSLIFWGHFLNPRDPRWLVSRTLSV